MAEELKEAQKHGAGIGGTYGDVEIAEEVIAVIAGIAASGTEGVAALAGSAGSLQKNIISRLGMQVLSKGVQLSVEEDKVTVNISLVLDYGVSIPEVTANVQSKVRSEIESMTGLTVETVNVRVTDVKTEED
ncbi:MAG: Asp23/Gls24 family envelope stress response protein [Lachnospiraceae bacterium]|nr:Asp23/Gls24 family envelope stress response protein [Lachnospiraceae bacterium]